MSGFIEIVANSTVELHVFIHHIAEVHVHDDVLRKNEYSFVIKERNKLNKTATCVYQNSAAHRHLPKYYLNSSGRVKMVCIYLSCAHLLVSYCNKMKLIHAFVRVYMYMYFLV